MPSLFEPEDPGYVTRLFDHTAILKSPLQCIGNGQISDLRASYQQFVRDIARFDLVDWKHPLLQEGQKIVLVSLIVKNLANPGGGLEVGRVVLFHKDHVLNIKMPRLACRVVSLIIDEDQNRVAEPEDFLPGRLIRARRLRLLDACNLHVHVELGKVDAFGGGAFVEFETSPKVLSELVLELRANSLAIGDAEEFRFMMSRFQLREFNSFGF